MEAEREEPETWRLKPGVSAGESLRTRRAWGSSLGLEAARGGSSQARRSTSGVPPTSWASVSGPPDVELSSICLSPETLRTSSLSREITPLPRLPLLYQS